MFSQRSRHVVFFYFLLFPRGIRETAALGPSAPVFSRFCLLCAPGRSWGCGDGNLQLYWDSHNSFKGIWISSGKLRNAPCPHLRMGSGKLQPSGFLFQYSPCFVPFVQGGAGAVGMTISSFTGAVTIPSKDFRCSQSSRKAEECSLSSPQDGQGPWNLGAHSTGTARAHPGIGNPQLGWDLLGRVSKCSSLEWLGQ